MSTQIESAVIEDGVSFIPQGQGDLITLEPKQEEKKTPKEPQQKSELETRDRAKMTTSEKVQLLNEIGLAAYLAGPKKSKSELRRSIMTVAEKTEYIAEHGKDVFLALPY